MTATVAAVPPTPNPAPALALAEAPSCDAPADTLSRIQCTGTIRIGVRSGYPPFASWAGGRPEGFEIDLAAALAARLGVVPRWVAVTPAHRFSMLGEGQVDVVVATTGHTVQRDAQALFVRPHYYQSQTVIVGRRGPALAALDSPAALAGRTVCVTVGNATNAELSTRGARLMLFADARQLVEQLETGGCALAAQDDSLFAHHFQQPGFAARFEARLGFSPLPWGAVVARPGGERLAEALGQALQGLHADGSLLALARRHGVDGAYLEAQQRRWRAPPCDTPEAIGDARCLDPPHDPQLQPTPFAAEVFRLQAWLEDTWGLRLTLAMLHTEIALRLFLQGMAWSVALVAGAVAATVGLGLAFGAGLGARRRVLRWPARAVLVTMQSTPLVLLMVFAGALISALGWVSPPVAWAAAVGVLGLFNGSNVGQAIAEARDSLRDESPATATLGRALRRARAQVMAFAVNAARGSPAASLIGVPELLSAQTDIASFSSERVSTFTLLLVFYVALVSVVVALGRRWVRAAEARDARDRAGATAGVGDAR